MLLGNQGQMDPLVLQVIEVNQVLWETKVQLDLLANLETMANKDYKVPREGLEPLVQLGHQEALDPQGLKGILDNKDRMVMLEQLACLVQKVNLVILVSRDHLEIVAHRVLLDRLAILDHRDH